MTILALDQLYDRVVARFLAEGPAGLAAANRFGWREPTRQLAPNVRIEWVPGDPSGNAGEIGGAKYPGKVTPVTGRPLASLGELFTVYLHGHDPAAPQSERAQWKATRILFDRWYRAVYLAAHGTYRIRKTEWLIEKNEKRFGATLRVVGAIESMIPDTAPAFAPADAGAEIDVTELEVIEAVIVPSP